MRANSEAEIVEAVRTAREKNAPIEIVGRGTKRNFGRPVEGEVLDVSGLRGIVSYEPEELIVTVKPGTPIAELGANPDNGAQVRVLEGRYGPYVTDGTTNATVPRGLDPAQVTLDEAVGLLRARAEKGPAKVKKAAKKTAKKAAKKTTKKAAKKTTKKAAKKTDDGT